MMMRRVFFKSTLILTLVASLFAGQGEALSLGKTVPANFADIVEPLLPSTVNIWTSTDIKRPKPHDPSQMGPRGGQAIEELFRQFLEGMQQGHPKKSNSLGSGFLISQEGDVAYIVTCNHVIAGADEIKITLHDGAELDAQVVGRDKRTDLALLKVQTKKKLTIANWGDSSKARVGEWVIAIGNPFGLGSTVTTGIISTIARDIAARSRTLGGADYVSGYIQTDAPINMGNSGGAMFDISGKVLAVSTAIYSPNGGNIGIGFGIPANLAQKVIEQLKKYGRTKRGWLGVRIQNITPEIAESLGLKEAEGALVGDVARKGPGQKAGIKTQDVILNFNGVTVKESKDLPHIVGESEIGKEVPVIVWRNGKKVSLKVNVGEFEQAEKEGLINLGPETEEKVEKAEQILGLVTREVTAGIRERYKLSEDVKGVFVTFVSPNSEAFAKFLRPGDIIQQLTSGTMKLVPTKPEDIQNFLETLKKDAKKKVLLLVNSQGNLRYVALSLVEESTDDEGDSTPSKANKK
tara:strand:- start:1356 stop:2915 length:1560 start_codon:yes stop_codon:yes gene_type:complete